MNEDADVAEEAFRLGTSAYVLKRSTSSELAAAMREVIGGRTSPRWSRRLGRV